MPYDPSWPEAFEAERDHLRACLPAELIGRIEHFGSTAVPGLSAKPIVDMLVEVTDLEAVRERVVPILEAQGYDYIWRPTIGDDGPPWYAWFIKRDPATGERTHHIHMVEASFAEHWDRLLFRDYLIEHPDAGRGVRDAQDPAGRGVGRPRRVHAGQDGVRGARDRGGQARGRRPRRADLLTERSVRAPDGLGYMSFICMTAKTAPSGSESTQKTHTGISMGSISALPPRALAFSTTA